ncbi:DUF4863 family protein [Piscinibacter sakaiensis]|uniref:4-hydroxylaminobenzoate lyase n=1 Tax=Piscinibacter sakaiensis TaxID=1547922 RepID=UPI003AB001A4
MSQTDTVTPESFKAQLAQLTAQMAGRPLDDELGSWLNREWGPDSETYAELKASCIAGAEAGWLCNREGGGIRYGRIFKPTPELHGFSVDVVDMKDVVGPHHMHPNGEIDLVMPLEGDARFNGQPAGWLVCPPGSAHHPTVSDGRALVLYLLPEGRIEFTR